MAVRESALSGETDRAPARDLSTSSERETDDRWRILEGGPRGTIRSVAESHRERDDGRRDARGDPEGPVCTPSGRHEYGRGRGLRNITRASGALQELTPRDGTWMLSRQ